MGYKMSDSLPVFLNMVKKKILVIGGGEEAFEQILFILESAPNSEIRVVGEIIDKKIEELQEVCSNLSISVKTFEISDIENQEIVLITIEDEKIISQIYELSSQKGFLINTIHRSDINDFYFNPNVEEPSEIHQYTEKQWKKIAFVSIAAFFVLILGAIINLFVSYEEFKAGLNWLAGDIDDKFYWMILVGFIAQLIDGLLGMGYGLSSTAALLSIGIPLPAISGSIHTAEVFSSGASGLSHYKFGNINKKLLKFLIIPGVVGAILGAVLLSKFSLEYSNIIKPILAFYTLLLGIRILFRVFAKKKEPKKVKNVGWLAFCGGFLDSFGGGGWGPLVTTTLISKGKTPRFVIGTVSLSEFFITLASALTFFAFLGLSHWQVILGLVLGGVMAAPLAARLAGKLPMKAMFIGVGVLVILWSLNILVKMIL